MFISFTVRFVFEWKRDVVILYEPLVQDFVLTIYKIAQTAFEQSALFVSILPANPTVTK